LEKYPTSFFVHSKCKEISNEWQLKPAADLTSKFRGGGDFSNIWQSSLITGSLLKYTSQHCCDKTMDDKMALHCESCFTNCTKSRWI